MALYNASTRTNANGVLITDLLAMRFRGADIAGLSRSVRNRFHNLIRDFNGTVDYVDMAIEGGLFDIPKKDPSMSAADFLANNPDFGCGPDFCPVATQSWNLFRKYISGTREGWEFIAAGLVPYCRERKEKYSHKPLAIVQSFYHEVDSQGNHIFPDTQARYLHYVGYQTGLTLHDRQIAAEEAKLAIKDAPERTHNAYVNANRSDRIAIAADFHRGNAAELRESVLKERTERYEIERTMDAKIERAIAMLQLQQAQQR